MMDLLEIRKLAIIAMFSDDVLFDRLVLKGGNALNIVYRIGTRASRDLDFSISDDFEDLQDTKERIFRALRDRFATAGVTVFDETLTAKPSTGGGDWGGYIVEFKIIETDLFDVLKSNLDDVRKHAEVTGPLQRRKFQIQISKYEFCDPKTEADVDGFAIFVYTPAMIAIEKLRAICQQMEEYGTRRHPTPRGRDFYDIHTIVANGVDLTTDESVELLRHIFAAKEVALGLLREVDQYREFHRQDWPSVVISVTSEIRDFDFYFDFVLAEIGRLQAAGIV